MRSYTTAEIVKKFKELGHKIPDFHMAAIRSNADVPDSFDDKFYLLNHLNQVYIEATCTTNPGVYWLQNFMNSKGTAILPIGQHVDGWKLGKHKGVYDALVQARPLTVWRDKDKDNKSEEGTPDTGMFGINIHRANETLVSKIINQWSAGCCVINDPSKFKSILDECKKSQKKLFTLTILKEF